MPRTALTRSGQLVPLGVLIAVAGGWEGFVVDRAGYAVRVFVPA